MADKQINLIVKLVDQVSKSVNKIKGNVSNFSKDAKKAMSAFGDSMKSTLFSAVALGQILAQALFSAFRTLSSAIKEASQRFQEFESGLNKVFTLLDQTSSEFENQKRILTDVAKGAMKQYGFAIKDVNQALFDAVSAGVQAGEAQEFFDAAAKLALGGVTDLGVAVDGITSVINAYGLQMSEATDVANAFFTAQKFGKTTVEELSNNIGKVAPIARVAGVSMEELLAATSQLTLAGISTEESTTALKSTIQKLIAPTDDAAKKFTELGIPFGQAAVSGGRFGETLQMLFEKTKGNADALIELLPELRAFLGAAGLGSKEALANYNQILEEIQTNTTNLTDAANSQVKTVEKQIEIQKRLRETAMLPLGKIIANIELGFLKLGNAAVKTNDIFGSVIGIFTQLFSVFGKVAEKIAEVFGWDKKLREQRQKAADERKKQADEELKQQEIIELRKKQQLENDKEIQKLAKQKNKEQLERIEKSKKAEAEKEELRKKAIAEKRKDDQEQAEAEKELAEQKKLFVKASADFEKAADKATAEFNALSNEEKLNVLRDRLGEEKIMRLNAKVAELEEEGKFKEALQEMDRAHFEVKAEIARENIEASQEFQEQQRQKQIETEEIQAQEDLARRQRGWSALIAGEKLTAEERKSIEKDRVAFFDTMMGLMQSKNKTFFEIGKGFAIANTLFRTFEGAQLAFNRMAEGIPGPPGVIAGIAAAGAATVAGLARVDSIRKTKPPKAQEGGLVSGSDAGSVIAGDARRDEAFLPINNPRAVRKMHEAGIGAGVSSVNANLMIDDEMLARFVIHLDRKGQTMSDEGVR